jgi:basic membrane protein A
MHRTIGWRARVAPWSLLLALTSAVALSACGGDGGGDQAAAGGTGGAAGAKSLKAAVLLPGTRNDQSWNSFGFAGIESIKKELGATTAFAENVADADEENALRTFANQGFGLIFGHTDRFQSSMLDVGPDFPNTTFVAVAGTEGNGKNVASIDVAREQFGYVEGYIAGKMTKSNTVGVVSGLEGLPVTVATVGGFRLGLKAANPNAKARVVYLPDMEDSAAAKQAVAALASSDADVVLPFLNAGMAGAIEAAGEKKIYTFGRGLANTDLAPNSVLTNVAESWSEIYVATAKLQMAKSLKGDHQVFGFDTEKTAGTTGAALQYKEGVAINPVVPEAVRAEVEKVQADIASGELSIKPTKSDAESGV